MTNFLRKKKKNRKKQFILLIIVLLVLVWFWYSYNANSPVSESQHDNVFIAHNVYVGEKTMITACVEISGSTKIGRCVWLAPRCTITNKSNVGDHAFVGIGSVVIEPVKPNSTVVGNPARIIKKGV